MKIWIFRGMKFFNVSWQNVEMAKLFFQEDASLDEKFLDYCVGIFNVTRQNVFFVLFDEWLLCHRANKIFKLLIFFLAFTENWCLHQLGIFDLCLYLCPPANMAHSYLSRKLHGGLPSPILEVQYVDISNINHEVSQVAEFIFVVILAGTLSRKLWWNTNTILNSEVECD